MKNHLHNCFVVAFIALIIGIIMGSFEEVGVATLEINTAIYVGVLGVLGFNQDFKMLIQNGFTRKMIFTATFFMFCFTSGIMAAIDTIVSNLIHHFNDNYISLYSQLYGFHNLFMNWLWLFLLYILVCCLLYFVILVIHKIGKTASIYLGIELGACILMLISAFQYVFSTELINNIVDFLMKAFGFMSDGTINYIYPVLTLVLIISILASGAYIVIQHTELK